MFDMSSRPQVPPDNTSHLVAVAAIGVIVLGLTLYGPIDTIGHRVPLGPGAYLSGVAVAWLIKRRRRAR